MASWLSSKPVYYPVISEFIDDQTKRILKTLPAIEGTTKLSKFLFM